MRAGGRMTTMEWRQARSATGLLRTFSEAEVLEAADVHVAQRLTALASETDETVALAIALAVRALRNGSVCVDLRSVEQQVGVDGLPWPDVDGWLAAIRASTLAGHPPVLRLDGDLLYLDRYWLEEQQVCDDVRTMIAAKPQTVSPDCRPPVPDGVRGAARGGESGAGAGIDRADRRPGHREDDDGGAAAGTAGQRHAAADRAGGADGQGGGASAGGGAAGGRQARRGRPRRAGGMHATTLHRLLGSRPDTSAQVPPQPGQPAAARRDRRRRDVDGVADDDGAAAGGGAARCAADPGRRPGPVGVGGGGRGAGGPGRRAGHARSWRR